MTGEPDVRIIQILPASLLADIAEFRFVRRLPSRAEAIRVLIRMGLTAGQLVVEPSPPSNG